MKKNTLHLYIYYPPLIFISHLSYSTLYMMKYQTHSRANMKIPRHLSELSLVRGVLIGLLCLGSTFIFHDLVEVQVLK